MIIIDRIEGDRAVVEFGDVVVDLPRDLLPAGAVEGSALMLVLASADDRITDAEARLRRLKARGSSPDDVDL